MNDINENSNKECEVIGSTLKKNELQHLTDITPRNLTGIYGLKCKATGKWYIGQSVNIHKRWGNYKKISCKRQPKLYGALKKYGYENFESEIIEYCDPVDWILNYREMYWIRIVNAFSNGYNCTEGGGGGKVCEETKRKISNGQKNMSEETRAKWKLGQIGKKHSPETCKKLSDISKNMSDETKLKMSLAAKGKKKKPFTLEHRANLSLSRLGKKHSEETKKKISCIQKGNRPWAREIAFKMSQRNIGKKQSPETIAKRMATIRNNRLNEPRENFNIDIALVIP